MRKMLVTLNSKSRIKGSFSCLLLALLMLIGSNPAYARVEDNAGSASTDSTTNQEPKVFDSDLSPTQWYSTFLSGSFNASKDSYKPLIAVIGDGADESFPDFKGRVLTGYNFAEKRVLKKGEFAGFSKGGYYGTSLASLLISNKNGKYLTGTSSNAQILPLVVTSSSTTNDEMISKAVDYAVSKRADYIIFALGIDQYIIDGKALKTCKSISNARRNNVLTFVDVYNSESIIKYSFKLSECDSAIKVGSFESSFTRLKNLSPEVRPDFSMPAGNISVINSNGSYLPYGVLDDSIVSPAFAAGLFANFTLSHNSSKTKLLTEFLQHALPLGSEDYFGKGVIYDYKTKRDISKLKSDLLKGYAPKIIEITRNDNSYSLTWEPTLEKPEYYLISSYKYTKTGWGKIEQRVGANEVRAVVQNFDIYSNAFTQVTAVFKGYKISSIPSFDARTSVGEEPKHDLPASEAAVISSTVKWSSEGIEVSVNRNDKSYSWDLLLIDPYTGDILKKYSTSASDNRLISINKENSLRSKVLLVATGIGKNGVDYILMPDYLLSVKANAAGKEYAAFSGNRVCVEIESIKCDLTSVGEGESVIIYDGVSGRELGRTKIASDGSYAILIAYTSKDYNVIVKTLSGAKSNQLEGSFLFR